MNFRPPLPLNPPTISSVFPPPPPLLPPPLILLNNETKTKTKNKIKPSPKKKKNTKTTTNDMNETEPLKLYVPEEEQDIIQSEEGYLIFNPYNSLNTKITKEEVEGILSSYGISYPIRNVELYQRAFIHRSYTKRSDTENQLHRIRMAEQPADCLPLSSKSNERLEFLGDGILELIVKFYLYRRFPKEPEGFMTEKKIAIVKNESIGKIAMEMGLQKWLILSKHAEEKKIRGNLKKLGCLFEAFLGAVFLDFNSNNNINNITTIPSASGFEIARMFLENILEQHIDWTVLLCNDDNYKNILQVKIQREFKVTPTYLEIGKSNPETGFCMGVYLCLGLGQAFCVPNDAIPVKFFASVKDIHTYIQHHGTIFLFLGNGAHKTKRKAEQFACKAALQELEHLTDLK